MPKRKIILGVYDTKDNDSLVMLGTYDEVAVRLDKKKKYIKTAVSKKSRIGNRYLVEKTGMKEGEEIE